MLFRSTPTQTPQETPTNTPTPSPTPIPTTATTYAFFYEEVCGTTCRNDVLFSSSPTLGKFDFVYSDFNLSNPLASSSIVVLNDAWQLSGGQIVNGPDPCFDSPVCLCNTPALFELPNNKLNSVEITIKSAGCVDITFVCPPQTNVFAYSSDIPIVNPIPTGTTYVYNIAASCACDSILIYSDSPLFTNSNVYSDVNLTTPYPDGVIYYNGGEYIVGGGIAYQGGTVCGPGYCDTSCTGYGNYNISGNSYNSINVTITQNSCSEISFTVPPLRTIYVDSNTVPIIS